MDGPSARFGCSLAVVIGIDQYDGGIPPLRTAVADACAIAEALRTDHGFDTWCLLNDNARLARLMTLLRDELPARLGPADRLVFYFAGHGIALESHAGPAGYLVPAGARRSERADLLAMHVVHGELMRLPVRHALVILDCCFAGAFRWSSLRDIVPATGPTYRERYDRYLERPAWQVLTSTSSDQQAFDLLSDTRGDATGGHSPFARALLDGLAGAADYTRDGVITADELAIYIREHMAPAVESSGRRQVPQLFPLDRHDGGQFVFQVPDRPIALAPAPPVDERANPYRGLESFHEADHDRFFGRDALTRRLVEMVVAQRLTVVVGPSGAGKSSLVHAGLVPALRGRGWSILPTQRPGTEPLAALNAWTRVLDGDPAAADPVAAWLAAATRPANAQRERLVVIDQLEELWTHRIPEADRMRFLEGLAGALDRAPGLRLVVTVRSDAEPQFHDSALASWWTPDARIAVTAMTRDELRQAIEQPASTAVLHFEPPRLVDRLIDDVVLVPAPLPLLSFVLSELYRRCWTRWQLGTRDRELREADYEEMGSVARALTQRATGLLDQLAAEDPALAITTRNVFVRMVAVTGGELARRRVPRDELRYPDPDEDRRVEHVLQRFHEARLVSLGAGPAEGDPAAGHAEPAHDELVRGWTKVSAWLDELDAPAGTRALLSALGDAVRPWRTHGRDDLYLWADARAEQLAELARNRPFVFNADEDRFARRSLRVRRIRRTRVIGVLLGVILALGVAAAIAWSQRESARSSAGEAEQQRRLAEHRLGMTYLEQGRALLIDDHPMQALPYFVAARVERIDGPVIRMLFAQAASHMPQVTLADHRAAVTIAAFSPDGTRIITAADRVARIWNAATGGAVSPPLEHATAITAAAFSPDGVRVLTASRDGSAQVWDATTGARVAPQLLHRSTITAAAFSPDGARVVTASYDHTARVWDAATGAPLTPPLAHRDLVASAAFSPDGTRVVTASYDRTTRVWDAETGQPAAPALHHDGIVRAAAFSPDGTRVVTAGEDSRARVWDARTGDPVTAPLVHTDHVTAATFSPDGALVLTVSDDRSAQLWNAVTGARVGLPLRHLDSITTAAFSRDGTRVVTASLDRTGRVWNASTSRQLGTAFEHADAVTAAAFSPDATRLVTTSRDRAARIWEVETERPASLPPEPHGAVNVAAFSPEGSRLLTAQDTTAQVWDVITGKPLAAPLAHRVPVTAAAFSPGGARAVTVSADPAAQTWNVQVWNAVTATPLASPRPHHSEVTATAFSPDGVCLVTASGDRAWVQDLSTGREVVLEHGGLVMSAAFSPNGERVVTAGWDHRACVWSAATGERLTGPVMQDGPVTAAVFSPDGTRVISAAGDHAQVWSATTGQMVSPSLEHQGTVTAVAFSPDGARAITGSADWTARLWDATTGEPLTNPLLHQARIRTAAFSWDGTRVVTASDDGKIRVWDAETGRLLMAPLEHGEPVIAATFSRDGTRVMTTSLGNVARVWTLAMDPGSLDDWRQLARCSPFVLAGTVPIANPAPGAICRPADRRH